MTRATITAFCGISALLATLATNIRAQNVIPNASFEIVGSSGNPVTAISPGGPSAAADWSAFLCSPNSTGTSQLVTSTDTLPGGGGLMMDFSTNGGFAGSCGNGLFANLTSFLPNGSTGAFDINVYAGTTGILGFVGTSGGFDAGSLSFGPTNGWQRVSFSADSTGAGEIGFEIFSGGGGEIKLDNGFAPTPEPASLALMLIGAGLAPWLRRRCKAPVL